MLVRGVVEVDDFGTRGQQDGQQVGDDVGLLGGADFLGEVAELGDE